MSTTDRPPRTSDPRAWGVYLRSRRFSLELADSRAFHVDDVYDRSGTHTLLRAIAFAYCAMGLCSSYYLSADDKRALEQSKAIDSTNCKHHNAEQEKTKLLLLGAGESGKSTVFKQFQILYGTGKRVQRVCRLSASAYHGQSSRHRSWKCFERLSTRMFTKPCAAYARRYVNGSG
jgi:hypothetical protein